MLIIKFEKIPKLYKRKNNKYAVFTSDGDFAEYVNLGGLNTVYY